MTKKEQDQIYISLAEAAKLCKYSQDYLSLRARQGKLKAVKFDRNWMTTKEWLQEYLGKSDPARYISLSEAAKLCRYSQDYLSLRARQGKLKAVKFDRNWMTTKEWLREYLGKSALLIERKRVEVPAYQEKETALREARVEKGLKKEEGVPALPSALEDEAIETKIEKILLPKEEKERVIQLLRSGAIEIWRLIQRELREKTAILRLLLRIFANTQPVRTLAILVGIYFLIINGFVFAVENKTTFLDLEIGSRAEKAFLKKEKSVILAINKAADKTSEIRISAGSGFSETLSLLGGVAISSQNDIQEVAQRTAFQIKYSGYFLHNSFTNGAKYFYAAVENLPRTVERTEFITKSHIVLVKANIDKKAVHFFLVYKIGFNEIKYSYQGAPENIAVFWNKVETLNADARFDLERRVRTFVIASSGQIRKIAVGAPRATKRLGDLAFSELNSKLSALEVRSLVGETKLAVDARFIQAAGVLKGFGEGARGKARNFAFAYSVGLKVIGQSFQSAPQNIAYNWRNLELKNEHFKRDLSMRTVMAWRGGHRFLANQAVHAESLALSVIKKSGNGLALARQEIIEKIARLNDAVWQLWYETAYALRVDLGRKIVYVRSVAQPYANLAFSRAASGLLRYAIQPMGMPWQALNEPSIKLAAVSFEQFWEAAFKTPSVFRRGAEKLRLFAEAVIDAVSGRTITYYRKAVGLIPGTEKPEEIAERKVVQETRKEGVVVVPSTDRDEEVKKKIRDSFSDEVKVEIQDETSGIITPVFRDREGDRYLYMMVPISEQN